MCAYRQPASQQSKNTLSTKQQKLETTSGTNLLDLHDYCLDDIFIYFNVIELCSVTRVCKRFQELAELHFKRKFSEFDFSTFPHRLFSSEEARDVLRNFGPLIKSLTIPSLAVHNHDTVGHVEEELLKHIVEFCDETLLTLTLKKFCFTSHAVDLLNMLSKSLQELSLLGCEFTVDCVFHLSNFSTLKYLAIVLTRDCYALLDSFPALEYLRLDRVSMPSESILKHFFVRHKQLTTLIMTRCRGISSHVVRSISKYLENLADLRFLSNFIDESEPIEQIQNNILPLCELKNLHSFMLDCRFPSVDSLLVKMLAKNLALKRFAIGNGVIDNEMIKEIKKMKNVISLGFFRTTGLKDQHLVEIVKELTQLKEFIILWQRGITYDVLKKILCHTKELMKLWIFSEKFHFHPTMYNDILNIVKKRQNGSKLLIKIYSTDDSTDLPNLIPPQTIRMNEKWLKIERAPLVDEIL